MYIYIIYIALHDLLQSVLIKHFTKSLKRGKKGIPYSQALRLNRICSDPNSFDIRCHDFEIWLIERNYS